MLNNDDPSHEMTEQAIREIFRGEPLTLTVERLATLLGQGRETTYRMLNNREIPATRLPNDRWLIYSAAICNWLIHINRTIAGDHDG